MTNTRFTDEYDEIIRSARQNPALGSSSDKDIAARIMSVAGASWKTSNEEHDEAQIIDRIRYWKARQAGPGNKNAGAGTSTGAGAGAGSQSGSGGFGSVFSNFGRNFAYNASNAGSNVGRVAGSMASGIGTFGSAIGQGLGATAEVYGMPQLYQATRRAAKASAAGMIRGGRSFASAFKSATSGFKSASIGANRIKRARSVIKSRGQVKLKPYNNPWGSQYSAFTGAGSGGGTGGGPGKARGGQSGNQAGAMGDHVNNWLLNNVMPQGRGVFGAAGGLGGQAIGGAAGGPLGAAIGQFIGTHVGNFVDSLKEGAVHAHKFAVALQESNRRFMYYNASISMSYVESDLASMMKDMRVAKAVAPSTMALNRTLTNYEEITTQRDILTGNLGNTWGMAMLGIHEQFEKFMEPIYKDANEWNAKNNPEGGLGKRWTDAITSAMLIGPAFLKDKDSFMGQIKNTAEAIQKLIDGAPPANGGARMGPWDRFISDPRIIGATDGVQLRKKQQPLGGRMKF